MPGRTRMDEFDYVIVGSGTAGSLLANRLSEDGTATVCLLEAGGRDWNPYIHIPAGFMKTLMSPRVTWGLMIEGNEWTAGRKLLGAQGKTLGGSSSINGHIYNRGQAADFDGWAQRGNRGWSFAEVLPYFRKTEKRIGPGDEAYRGRDGALVVSDIGWHHPICEAFIAGAVGLGIPRNADYNGARQEGVGYFQRAIHRGRRVSSARAFLHPAMGRRNLHIRTHTHASAIVLDGKRATGVRYLRQRGGAAETVRARREVILAAGAWNSPKLLQLSGVGTPDLLQERGIVVRHALNGVGENLRDHYAPRFVVRARGAVTINEMARGPRLWAEIGKWGLGLPSILQLSPSLVFVFWKSDPVLDAPDLQIVFTPASYRDGVVGILDDFPGMTCGVWQERPESSGHVRIRSSDPFDEPKVWPNYLSHEMDRRVLINGMRLTRQLLAAPELAPYYDREEMPGAEAQSDDELMDFAKRKGSSTFHLCGSCRMGPASDPTAVVDADLRVHGLDGLRVVDASVMPTMVSANTNVSTFMIAEKAADLIRGRAPLPAAAV